MVCGLFGFWEKKDQLWLQFRPLSIKKPDRTGLSNTNITDHVKKFASLEAIPNECSKFFFPLLCEHSADLN
jgi:hypothetical protein